MTPPEPPRIVRILFCETCGRTQPAEPDESPRESLHVAEYGGMCWGRRVVLKYQRPTVLVDDVVGTAPLRAAIQVAATITPALPHLSDPGDRSSIVGTNYLVAAWSVSELVSVIEQYTDRLVSDLTECVAAHPRPDSITGWPV